MQTKSKKAKMTKNLKRQKSKKQSLEAEYKLAHTLKKDNLKMMHSTVSFNAVLLLPNFCE